MKPTNSVVVNRLIARAEKLGLVVAVEVDAESYQQETITANITRPQRDENTMLDMLDNSGSIHICAVRGLSDYSTHRFHIRVTKFAMYCEPRALTLGAAPYAIDIMGERAN